MRTNLLILFTIVYLAGSTQLSYAGNPVDSLENVAELFVKVVDANDAEQLKAMLHPEMIQFVKLGKQLIPFKAADFIQMVADKKIGGKPRTIEIQSANILRGHTGEVRIRAVSEEYDFMYQVSMAKQKENWIITGILVDILPV